MEYAPAPPRGCQFPASNVAFGSQFKNDRVDLRVNWNCQLHIVLEEWGDVDRFDIPAGARFSGLVDHLFSRLHPSVSGSSPSRFAF